MKLDYCKIKGSFPAVLFRFPNEAGGWYGIAFARDAVELFWIIDQHGNPNACEVSKIKSGSMCVKLLIKKDDEIDPLDNPNEIDYFLSEVSNDDDNFEVSENIGFGTELNWFSPKWPSDEEVYP